MHTGMTKVGRAMVSLGIQATRGAYNHYRVLKVLAEVGDLVVHSREIGRRAREVLLDRDDFATLQSFGVTKQPDSDIRFTDTFGRLRRMGLLEYTENYSYRMSNRLRKSLEGTSSAQLELDFSSSPPKASNVEKQYLYVTIKVPRYKWLEQHIDSQPSYFIGGAKVDKLVYENFLENNKEDETLLSLAKVTQPELPLWSQNVPIVKVKETID